MLGWAAVWRDLTRAEPRLTIRSGACGVAAHFGCLAANGQDWAGSVRDYFVSDGDWQVRGGTRETARFVGAENDEVRIAMSCDFQDLLGG